jgi:hypothetical protein
MVERNIEAVSTILVTDSRPELSNKVHPLKVLPSGDCEDCEKVERFTTCEAGNNAAGNRSELGLTE